MTAPTPTQAVSIRMPTHVVERIDAYGAKTGLSRTATILLATQNGLEVIDPSKAERRANLPEGAGRVYADWLNGMGGGEIAKKYGLEDRVAAMKIVREVQLATLIKPHSEPVVIRVDPARISGSDD